MRVCVCVCVCVWDREEERERELQSASHLPSSASPHHCTRENRGWFLAPSSPTHSHPPPPHTPPQTNPPHSHSQAISRGAMGRSAWRREIEEQKEKWDETSHTSRKGNGVWGCGGMGVWGWEGGVRCSYPKPRRRAGNTHKLFGHTTAKHCNREEKKSSCRSCPYSFESLVPSVWICFLGLSDIILSLRFLSLPPCFFYVAFDEISKSKINEQTRHSWLHYRTLDVW